MGKEETIRLIRQAHTSPAEIKQKSLLLWASRLTPVLPATLAQAELPGGRVAQGQGWRALIFSPGQAERSALPGPEDLLCWHIYLELEGWKEGVA